MADRILIIDDEKDIRELLQYNFESRGYKVFAVGSSEEGLHLLKKQEFDLALVDLLLPGISGIEFCRRVRKSEKHKSMCLIMLTASDAEDHIVTAMESGADMYLNKPFAPNELAARVQGLLRRRQEIKHQIEDQMVNYVRGGLQHAFNQPLTVMFGNLCLLESVCAGCTQQKELVGVALRDIRGAVTRLHELLQKLAHTTHIRVSAYPGDEKIFSLEWSDQSVN